jgi:hypothetical protein
MGDHCPVKMEEISKVMQDKNMVLADKNIILFGNGSAANVRAVLESY